MNGLIVYKGKYGAMRHDFDDVKKEHLEILIRAVKGMV
jgi:hypothetical protein